MLNPSKLREDTLGLTLEHEIQRCRLQDLVILKEPQQALIAINLPCPSDDRGDLRSRSFQSPELLDLLLQAGNRLVNGLVNFAAVYGVKTRSGSVSGMWFPPRRNLRSTN